MEAPHETTRGNGEEMAMTAAAAREAVLRTLNANQPRRGNELDTCNYILRKYVIRGTFVHKFHSLPPYTNRLAAAPPFAGRLLAVHSFLMILSFISN